MKRFSLFRQKRHARTGPSDYVLVASIVLLVGFGLAMLASASSYVGSVRFDDPYHYLKHQVLYGLSIGIVGFVIASKVYYRSWEKAALPLMLLSILLLVLVFTPLGVTAKGASRWLTIGPATFQPSEILKLTFLLYLASWLSKHPVRQRSLREGLVPFLVILGIVGALLVNQPATSTVAILIATAVVVYFVSGAKLSYVGGILLLGAVALSIVTYLTPYRFDRVTSFLQRDQSSQAGGFHLSQALIAIGSGQLTGVGYGQSTTKISYLPEPIGDSIFAVIAEELGFIGSMVLLLLFLTLTMRMFILSRRTPDRFGQLLLVGFGSLLAIQTFVNIGAISGILPLTGTPLPFISFGGTALAVFMTMGGIAVNVSKYAH